MEHNCIPSALLEKDQRFDEDVTGKQAFPSAGHSVVQQRPAFLIGKKKIFIPHILEKLFKNS